MAPKKPPSSSSCWRRRRASFSSISAGREVGVDRHLLARHGVQVKARGDFGDAAGALGDDHEVHDHQDGEHDDADDEIAAHHEIAERLDDVAGGGGPFVAAREDEPGRGQIERQPQHGRDQQHGREGGEFQRRMDEQRRHQDQHREDDRDRQREIEQQRRQRQDQHHQNGHHADRERDVAALHEGAEVAEAGEGDAARRGRGGRCGGDVAHSTHRACRMVVFRKPVPAVRDHALPPRPRRLGHGKLTSSNRADGPDGTSALSGSTDGETPLTRQYLPTLWLAGG